MHEGIFIDCNIYFLRRSEYDRTPLYEPSHILPGKKNYSICVKVEKRLFSLVKKNSYVIFCINRKLYYCDNICITKRNK